MVKNNGNCPVCDAAVEVAGAEVSEILSCPDCKSRVVVKENSGNGAVLEEAPQIEEDWGE